MPWSNESERVGKAKTSKGAEEIFFFVIKKGGRMHGCGLETKPRQLMKGASCIVGCVMIHTYL
jgi:hypothetical protein